MHGLVRLGRFLGITALLAVGLFGLIAPVLDMSGSGHPYDVDTVASDVVDATSPRDRHRSHLQAVRIPQYHQYFHRLKPNKSGNVRTQLERMGILRLHHS